MGILSEKRQFPHYVGPNFILSLGNTAANLHRMIREEPKVRLATDADAFPLQ